MAKRKPVKKSPKKSSNPLLDRLPKNQEEYLEHLIKVSEAAITKAGSGVDEFFAQQADRIRKELEALRKGK